MHPAVGFREVDAGFVEHDELVFRSFADPTDFPFRHDSACRAARICEEAIFTSGVIAFRTSLDNDTIRL
jgi:hypothetical protein